MLKKTIVYEDLDGNPVEGVFYFSLNKAELIELEIGEAEGFSNKLKRIGELKDNRQILAVFKEIVLMSVGKRSEDGKRFVKNQEYRDEFSQSNAYSELLLEFFTDTSKAIEFFNGILPKSIASDTAQLELPAEVEEEKLKTSPPDWSAMSKEEIIEHLKKDWPSMS